MARPMTEKRKRGSLGKMVKESREAIGWTQQQLADAMGVHQARIGELESGINRVPQLETLLALSKALDLDLQELLDARIASAK